VNDLRGKYFVVFGWDEEWPGYLLPSGLSSHLEARGAILQEELDEQTDYVVLGRGRQKGKAKATRKVDALKKKGRTIEALNTYELFHLLRPDIKGLRFAFTGGFSLGAAGLEGGPAEPLLRYGALVSETVTSDINYLIVGERRAQGKTADLRKVEQLNREGAHILVVDEQSYMHLLSAMSGPDAGLDFLGFVVRLRGIVNVGKADRAIQMLKKESFKIYADVQGDSVSGIIKSQSAPHKYYASWLRNDGTYGCYDNELEQCMGLQGETCKHILVLLMGLSCNGNLEPGTALNWVTTCHRKPPIEDEDPSAQMLLRYKAVEAGEIDWRPTETVPEDYYIL
jgi:hypothetical protein